MNDDFERRLLKILSRDLGVQPKSPERTMPWLIIAPYYQAFTYWCQGQGLNYRTLPVQAIYIRRPEDLRGRANLRDNLFVLGYPLGARGRALREYVEAILAVQEVRR